MKMHFFARVAVPILTCLMLAPLGAAQARQPGGGRLGKSGAQILAMGLEGWTDYYYAKRPNSGVVKNAAYGVYVACMRERNVALSRRLPKAAQTRVRRMSLLLQRYAVLMRQNQNDALGGQIIAPDEDSEVVARAEYELLGRAKGPAVRAGAAEIEAFRRRETGVVEARQKLVETIRQEHEGGRASQMLSRLEEAAAVQTRLKAMWRDAREASTVLRALRELTTLAEPYPGSEEKPGVPR